MSLSRAAARVRTAAFTVAAAAAKALSERLLVREPPRVTLSTLAGWRYPVFLLNALAAAAVVAVDWRDVGAAARALPARLFWRRVRIATWLPIERRGVLIVDGRFGRAIRAARSVGLEPRYYGSRGDRGVFVLPYFAHPSFYEQDLGPLARRLRERTGPRAVRLFFSGTVDEAHYAAAARFGILTRPVIVSHLERRLQEAAFAGLRSRTQLFTSADVSADAAPRFPLSEFLTRLAAADFCLCPPGCGMPHSHNIVEAMAVGTIPVTNYAQFMSPPLRHGIDCLAFDTVADLDRVLGELAALDDAAVARMRAAVAGYYQDYLDPRAVGERLLRALDSTDRLAVNDETGR